MTKVKCDELEVIKMYISSGFIITVEIFTVPGGYKSFANCSFIQPDYLIGTGFHSTKKGSVMLAVKEFHGLLLALPES
ncbi:hypothetical protein V7089_21850 [Neobacillus drentensis]